jgi:hypothetical protein
MATNETWTGDIFPSAIILGLFDAVVNLATAAGSGWAYG